MKNISILALTIIMVLTSCEEKDLVKEMVDFDQLFIPAYYFAYTNDMDRAKVATFPLKKKWNSIAKIYGERENVDEDWKGTFRLVGFWIDEAEISINEKEAMRCRIQLDHARYELMDLRWREKIGYYLDFVWDFEATMDIVVETAIDPMMGLMDWHEFQMCCEEMNLQWLELSNKVPDGDLFHFTGDDWVNLNHAINDMNREMEYLMIAVDTADGCQFSEAAKLVEQSYLNFLYIFGDFDSIPELENNIDFARQEI